MSVSSILAYALQKYGNKLMNIKITDNYLYKNYMIIRELIDNIICWRLIWGYPPHVEKLLPANNPY